MFKKRLPLELNLTEYPKVLVVGNSYEASILFERCKGLNYPEDGLVHLSSNLADGYNLIIIVDTPENEEDLSISYDSKVRVTKEFCLGLSTFQKDLDNTDWKALRDIERQLLAMDGAGVWPLPEDVKKRLTAREVQRAKTELDSLPRLKTPLSIFGAIPRQA